MGGATGAMAMSAPIPNSGYVANRQHGPLQMLAKMARIRVATLCKVVSHRCLSMVFTASKRVQISLPAISLGGTLNSATCFSSEA